MTEFNLAQKKYQRNLVNIKKLTESQVIVSSFPEIKEKISNKFMFKAQNFYFHPLYKKRIWDGFIRLYNKTTGVFPTGLLPRLIRFLNEQGYEFETDETVPPTMVQKGLTPEEYFNSETAIELFHSLNLPSPRYDLREDQINAVVYAIRRERCLLVSPTGSGKSLVIYMLIRYFFQSVRSSKMCIAVIVPTAGLVEQMNSDFIEYSAGTDPSVFDPYRQIHRIHSGMERVNSVIQKSTECPVVISTWQSFHNVLEPEYFKSFQMVIGDEAHTFKANSLNKIMLEKMTNAWFRIGTTGTLDDEKINKMTLEGIFGPIKQVTTTTKMIEAGNASKLNIKCIHLQYPKDERTVMRGASYSDELDYICSYPGRNQFLVDFIEKLENNTLVLFKFKEKHGIPLYKMFKSLLKNKKILYVSGNTEVSKRELIRKYTEENNNVVILASLGTFSTGVNIRNLQNLVFVAPMKSKIKNLQSIGRVLRKDGKLDECWVYDIGDDLRIDTHKNYTFKHFKSRINTYKTEGFNYETITHKL